MNNHWIRAWSCGVCLALAGGVTVSHAEDVEKRWRLAFAIGGADSRDSIRSDAANFLVVTDDDEIPVQFFEDPRNDDAQHLTLQIKSRPNVEFSAQYAVTKVIILQVSGGYQTGDVGDVELQVEFSRDPIPVEDRFKFNVFKIPAGEIEQVPINVTALARFRPRASFNPYIGLGMGYTFNGFDPSDELNELSRNMDSSIGQFFRIAPFPGRLAPFGPIVDLEGVTVDVNDSWNWHVKGGIEYTFKRKWSTFFDMTYSFASQHMTLSFNPPGSSLGISVPNERVFEDDPAVNTPYGGVNVSVGGFVDGGRLVPGAGAPMGTDCDAAPQFCTFVFEPDGVPDPGIYYIKSGTLKFDDIVFLVGVRYTF